MKAFYGKLFKFLGFKVLDEYPDAIGWTNGKTRFWIGPADEEGKARGYRIGDIGFHPYAFELRSRKDVDDLEAFLKREGCGSSIRRMSITTTITPCSSSIRTGSSSRA